MRSRQRGVTFIGWLILLFPLAVVFYAGVRLTPIYLNYMKVVRGMNALQSEYKDGGASADGLRRALQRQFDIDSVDYPTIKDVKFTRDGGVWTVEAAFDDQAPLFSNISIQVAFDKVVKLGSAE